MNKVKPNFRREVETSGTMTETGDDANAEGEMNDILDPSMMESGGQGQVRKTPSIKSYQQLSLM